jgi:hypothetical protein
LKIGRKLSDVKPTEKNTFLSVAKEIIFFEITIINPKIFEK